MSSSVFIENSSARKDAGDYIADSNLVVVYGKNNISFDERGLENLMEEKKISSISVVRLTSPTPSMKEEELETAKLEEMLRRQELSSDDGSACEDQDCNSELNSEEKCNSASEGTRSNDEEDGKSNEESEGDLGSNDEKVREKNKSKRKPKRRGRIPNALKLKQLRPKPKKRERPEIIGLRVEEFYPPQEANEIIKEALKMAGLSSFRTNKEEYQFQLLVIQNDHCYTPFTSPNQMKNKLAADKRNLERQLSTKNEGALPIALVQTKHSPITKKLQTNATPDTPVILLTTKEKLTNVMNTKMKKDIKEKQFVLEDAFASVTENTQSSINEASNDDELGEKETQYIESDGSAETDNDRDSDLDFDVNNRNGRKRKVKSVKNIKRPICNSKIIQKVKKSQGVYEEADEAPSKVRPLNAFSVRQKITKVLTSDTLRITARSTPTKISQIPNSATTTLPQGKTLTQNIELTSTTSATPTHTNVNVVRKYSVVESNQMDKSRDIYSTTAKHASKVHREIVIQKMNASPKSRGFTDLKQLFDQAEKSTTGKSMNNCSPPMKTIQSVAKLSLPLPSTVTASTKGFMPLAMETAAQHKLPPQISIQTLSTSSGLRSESDKQLDLIDSIVKDELQKPTDISEVDALSANESIPQLVKMLKSTEQTLGTSTTDIIQMPVEKDTVQLNNTKGTHIPASREILSSSSAHTTAVGEIDIASAPLLASPDDELPDDILQDVVELIEDDKSLQEAVEKQVFGSRSMSSVGLIPLDSGSLSNITPSTPPPLAPISNQNAKSNNNSVNYAKESPNTFKSIIQMSIANAPISLTPTLHSYTISQARPLLQISKSSPLTRKEPIQIVRNNGRVITLPPIEAPTTRAKRRAQTQPPLATSVTVSESSLDSTMQSSASPSACSAYTHTLEKKQTDQSQTRRRSSKEQSLTTTATGLMANQRNPKRRSGGKKTAAKQTRPSKPESSESEDDDDDPNKLWCICRQPHNNRFMICCDICADWFHGTCVNVTKAMGLEMEQKGIDWTCPKCIARQEEKTQPKISDIFKSQSILPTTTGHSVTPTKVTSVVAGTPKNTSTSSISQQGQRISGNSTLTSQYITVDDGNGNKKRIIVSTTAATVSQKRLLVTSPKSIHNQGVSLKNITPTKSQTQQYAGVKIQKTAQSAISSPTVVQVSSSNLSPTNVGSTTTKDTGAATICIVCKKRARSNSIYCSDDCIRKHAQTALNTLMAKTQPSVICPASSTAAATAGGVSNISKTPIEDKIRKKPKGLFEDLLSLADRKPKIERVSVYERKSGRILTGVNAPTTANLKKWLQENPTFEVVQPGSLQALDIERKLKQKRTESPILKISGTSTQKYKISPVHTAEVARRPLTPQAKAKALKTITEYAKASSSSPSPRPGTPKDLQKQHTQQVSPKFEKALTAKASNEGKTSSITVTTTTTPNTKEKNSRQRLTDSSGGGSGNANKSDSEPIRLNVRRILKEQLLQRLKEDEQIMNMTNIPKLTVQEVEEFAKATELEMYYYFNKDTGTKYRAKYRSLVFNIKDRKNHTLFEKICGKLIEPKQLVRMSPEEMASQELAKWRENETKHQLEIIKKSELDLLACTKNYVLKTHKGEEVMEEKSTVAAYTNLDSTIPGEDLVLGLSSVLATETADGSSVLRKDSIQLNEPQDDSTVSVVKRSSDVNSAHIQVGKTPTDDGKRKVVCHDRARERERERDREKRNKSKDRHRDKSRSRKRSPSNASSRSHSRDWERRPKNSYKDMEKRGIDYITRDCNKEQYNRDKKTVNKTVSSHITVNKDRHRDLPTSSTQFSSTKRQHHHQQQHGSTKLLETFSLIDQILESSKTVEQAANLVVDKVTGANVPMTLNTVLSNAQTSAQSKTPSAARSSNMQTLDKDDWVSVSERDQEPTSTVFIPTPPQDPYTRFILQNSPSVSNNSNRHSAQLWMGNINMIDVASFQIIIQSVFGNHLNLEKLFPNELDVVGRISPETVWDYIAKIKKSPNKEIIIVRLIPSNESETSAYTTLYQYLENRNRLGVIKTTSAHIKDFYIYPLGCDKHMPSLLRTTENEEFFDDPYRPDILIGVIIRVISKRSHQTTTPIIGNTAVCNKFIGRSDIDSHTPPDSPKFVKKRRSSSAPKVDNIDIDAIIKAPIVSKNQKIASMVIAATPNDADEPYSPRSSDEDLPLLPIKLASNADPKSSSEDDLKRKMDEINRQIAAQEMEIAGLLTGGDTKTFASTSATSNVLANISIPSNLSQILASIKPALTATENQLTVAPPPPLIGSLIKPPNTSPPTATTKVEEYVPAESFRNPYNSMDAATAENNAKPSRLAQLSEAELLSMVPDDVMIERSPHTTEKYSEEPPPPGV